MTARGIDFTGIAYLTGFALVALAAWLVYAKRKEIGAAVNPFDQQNIANRGTEALVQSVTGGAASGGEDSLGGIAARFREWVTGTDAAIEAMKRGSTPPTWEDQLKASGGVYADGYAGGL